MTRGATFALLQQCDESGCSRAATVQCANCQAPLCPLDARVIPPGEQHACACCFGAASTIFEEPVNVLALVSTSEGSPK